MYIGFFTTLLKEHNNEPILDFSFMCRTGKSLLICEVPWIVFSQNWSRHIFLIWLLSDIGVWNSICLFRIRYILFQNTSLSQIKEKPSIVKKIPSIVRQNTCTCCDSIYPWVTYNVIFSFVSNSLLHKITPKKQKEMKFWARDKIESQHIYEALLGLILTVTLIWIGDMKELQW